MQLIKVKICFYFLILLNHCFAQQFLNGDFETNTAGGISVFNASNTIFNSSISNVTAFSSSVSGNTDLLTDDLGLGKAANCDYWVGLTGFDTIALTLSSPLAAGTSYTFQYYDRAFSSLPNSTIKIGVSAVNTKFGTTIYTAPNIQVGSAWTLRTVIFTPTINAGYITVCYNNVSGNLGSYLAYVDGFCFTPCNLNACQVQATITGTNLVCNKDSSGTATVTASSGSSPYTYSWVGTDNTNDTITSLNAGTYTVIVTDANSVTSTSTVIITEPNAINSTFTSTSPSCSPGNDGSITANASGGGGVFIYSWISTGINNATISNINAGTYTLQVTDKSSCSKTFTYVLPPSNPVTANAGPDMNIQQGQSASITTNGGTNYSWSPSGGLSCMNCSNPIASPTVTTTYILTVTDSKGCTDTDTLIITVFTIELCRGDVFIPTAFSPNNDGVNDLLKARSNCLLEFSLIIYNRWGEKIFESADIQQGWDGTYKNKLLDSGVFVYILKAVTNKNEKLEKQGTITLTR